MNFKPGDIVRHKLFTSVYFVLKVSVVGPIKTTPSGDSRSFYSYSCRTVDNSVIDFMEYELEKADI